MDLQIENYKDKHEYISDKGIRSVVYLMDCMEGLKQIPDKYFELAIVDPPYGINVNMNAGRKRDTKSKKRLIKKWDSEIPIKQYWEYLFVKATNQFVFGANYMTQYLPIRAGWVFWDKCVAEGCAFSDGELAWTSFNKSLKKAVIPYSGFIGMEGEKFHPTTKPIKLYEWIIKNYAKENDKILDTHLGSGSSRIAACKANLPFMGFELDEDYFKASVKRFELYTRQTKLF